MRPNRLTRYAESRSGVVASTASFAGNVASAIGACGRVFSTKDPVETERLYAQSLGVDRDRAHEDVFYVGQRLRLLSLAIDDEPDELVCGAARVLVAFVAAGRPPDQRLDEVEAAFAPLRAATDDGQTGQVIAELLPPYLDAWRRALG